MRTSTAILLALGLSILSGCRYDKEEILYPDRFCDPTDTTYTAGISPMIRTKCAISGCHVAGVPGMADFTRYDHVKVFVDNGAFRREVVDRRTMPPSPQKPLTKCEIDRITTWLGQGAPNN